MANTILKNKMRRCGNCGTVLQRDSDTVCKGCGEFFDDWGGIWMDWTKEVEAQFDPNHGFDVPW